MKKLLKIAALASIVFSTGCATIVSESSYPVIINSVPSGKTFVIKNRDGIQVGEGTTPYTIVLKAGAGYFQKEKYEIVFNDKKLGNKSFILEPTVDGWYLGGNLLFGGLIGYLVVDPLTGAMYKLPKSFTADLETGASTQVLNIMSIEDLTAEQKAHLEPISVGG